MKVYILRPAEYDYTLPGLSLYKSYDGLSKQNSHFSKVSLTTQQIQERFGDLSGRKVTIGSSKLERAVQTSTKLTSLVPGSVVVPAQSVFDELKFSMKELLSEAEFVSLEQAATNAARKIFIQKLTQDELGIGFADAIERAHKALEFIHATHADVLVIISHAFFMKVMEFIVYCEQTSIDETPHNFRNFYDGSIPAYKFFDGFSFTTKSNIQYKKGNI